MDTKQHDQIQHLLRPFTSEVNFALYIQNENYGYRRIGSCIAAIRKSYKGSKQQRMTTFVKDSFSIKFESIIIKLT